MFKVNDLIMLYKEPEISWSPGAPEVGEVFLVRSVSEVKVGVDVSFRYESYDPEFANGIKTNWPKCYFEKYEWDGNYKEGDRVRFTKPSKRYDIGEQVILKNHSSGGGLFIPYKSKPNSEDGWFIEGVLDSITLMYRDTRKFKTEIKGKFKQPGITSGWGF